MARDLFLTMAIRDLQQLLSDEPLLQKTFAALRPRVQAKPLKTLCRDGVSYTRRRVKRIVGALSILNAARTPRPTKGLRGLLHDAMTAAKFRTPERDALVIARIERISHYGLAAYTTVDRYLRKAHTPDGASAKARRLLMPSLHEKRDAIRDMSRMARKTILAKNRFASRAAD